MSRTKIPTRDEAPESAGPMLDAIGKQLGFVPNHFRLMSISPLAFSALAGLEGSLAKTLDLKTRERIALAISEVNKCHYCLAAHSYAAVNFAKISPEEIALNRQGGSSDPKAEAAVRFAVKVAEQRGHVSDADLAAVRDAGFTEAQIVDIVSLVIRFSFTNYINNVFDTDIDFPIVTSPKAA